jgi:hypothetical protein
VFASRILTASSVLFPRNGRKRALGRRGATDVAATWVQRCTGVSSPFSGTEAIALGTWKTNCAGGSLILLPSPKPNLPANDGEGSESGMHSETWQSKRQGGDICGRNSEGGHVECSSRRLDT